MSIQNQENTIEQFFKEYETQFNKNLLDDTSNGNDTSSAFADCFITASPEGIVCGKNDEQFLAAIPQGYEFYRLAGIRCMKIVATERTFIDILHAMVKVTWRSEYTNKAGVEGNITFDVTYLLRIEGESCRIFAYITGDEQAALKEHGLI